MAGPDGRPIRLWAGAPRENEEGVPIIRLWPDKNGAVLTIPERFRNSPYVTTEWVQASTSVCRFYIGSGDDLHLVRLMWNRELEAIQLRLPERPDAQPYIIWVPEEWSNEEQG